MDVCACGRFYSTSLISDGPMERVRKVDVISS